MARLSDRYQKEIVPALAGLGLLGASMYDFSTAEY